MHSNSVHVSSDLSNTIKVIQCSAERQRNTKMASASGAGVKVFTLKEVKEHNKEIKEHNKYTGNYGPFWVVIQVYDMKKVYDITEMFFVERQCRKTLWRITQIMMEDPETDPDFTEMFEDASAWHGPDVYEVELENYLVGELHQDDQPRGRVVRLEEEEEKRRRRRKVMCARLSKLIKVMIVALAATFFLYSNFFDKE